MPPFIFKKIPFYGGIATKPPFLRENPPQKKKFRVCFIKRHGSIFREEGFSDGLQTVSAAAQPPDPSRQSLEKEGSQGKLPR